METLGDSLTPTTVPEVIPLEMFVVYERPLDYPHSYVVRRHLICVGKAIVDGLPFLVGPDLEGIREVLSHRGLMNLGRHPEDDPVIKEVWV